MSRYLRSVLAGLLTLSVLGGTVVATTSVAAAQTAPTYDANGPQGTIYRLYRAYFLREPDRGGYDYWSSTYAAGYPLTAVSNDFARSAEFESRYGSVGDGEFVNLVYQNVLGRAPDHTGYDYWMARMSEGMPRGNLMINFSDSAEFRSKTAGGVPPGYTVATDLSRYLPPPPPGGTVRSDNVRAAIAARLIDVPGGCQELTEFFLRHAASAGLTVTNMNNPQTNPHITTDAWSFQTYGPGIHGFVMCTAYTPGTPALIDFSVTFQP